VLLEEITKGMTNVKHVVLTQRNTESISREQIIKSRRRLLMLRRRRLTSRVWGGCASMEFTNEGRGWHLHWHLLLHCRFMCASCIAWEWGQLCGQDFAICKVIPVEEKSYVQEVCKYAVKGSELAGWSGREILEWIEAQDGIRMFSVFGKFGELARFARAQIEQRKPPPEPCDCGHCEWYAGRTEKEAFRHFERAHGIR
jgi:hypothetical protein